MLTNQPRLRCAKCDKQLSSMMRRVFIPFRHLDKVQPYAEAARAAGLEPLTGSVSKPVSLQGSSGLLLMGGTDVNPSRYDAAPLRETDEPDDERDGIELALLDQAIQQDIPIFAICRGLQLLNVYCGGTLVQHLADSARHVARLENKGAPVHEVAVEPGSLLARMTGAARLQVNSRHHQAADRIGTGLRVTARDIEDGTVEALEYAGKRFVVAVQWHPEDQVGEFPEQLELFRKFADAL